jgi:hypothetical protein
LWSWPHAMKASTQAVARALGMLCSRLSPVSVSAPLPLLLARLTAEAAEAVVVVDAEGARGGAPRKRLGRDGAAAPPAACGEGGGVVVMAAVGGW